MTKGWQPLLLQAIGFQHAIQTAGL